MSTPTNRRQFLAHLGVAAVGATTGRDFLATGCSARAEARGSGGGQSRVVIARDEALTHGQVSERGDLLRKLLDASMQKLTGAADAATAWRTLFTPRDRIGIKVNTLGLSTQPAVAGAIAAGLGAAGIPPKNVLIWDRFDVELAEAGYRLSNSGSGVRCHGTDATEAGSGYQRDIESSGQIGSCFSRIVAEHVDTLICVPVLKDHNLAGVSLGMKNFYGAIHNPNKYHDNNCDPYVVDVVSHRLIRPKWKLTIVDATRAQYHGGPTRHPGFAWAYGGIIVSNDFVAADAVAADLLEAERKAKGLASLSEEKRPPKHILTASARGLGQADLKKIERIEV